jgi:hypothetical protein
VDDPLLRTLEIEQLDAELARVPDQRRHLARRYRVRDRQAPVAGGDVVVHGADRQLRPADPAARQPQALERLGRGDLMD